LNNKKWKSISFIVVLFLTLSNTAPRVLAFETYEEAYEAGRERAEEDIAEKNKDFRDTIVTGAAIVGGAVITYFLVKMAINWRKSRSSAPATDHAAITEMSKAGDITLGNRPVSLGLSLQPSDSTKGNTLAIESVSDIQPTLTFRVVW